MEQFWKFIGIGYLVTQTICLVMLLEMIVYGFPYITMFLVAVSPAIYYFLRKRNISLKLF